MKAQLRREFFRRINAQRAALEPSETVQNIVNPGVLYDWVLTVGGFLLENDVISSKDLDLGRALVEDYTDRFETLFPHL